MNAFLRNEAFRWRLIRQQIDVEVLWNVQERSSGVVDRIVDVKRRLGNVLLLLVAESLVAVLRSLRQQLVELLAFLIGWFRHLLLVLIGRPWTEKSVDVRRVVVSVFLTLRVCVLRSFLVRSYEQILKVSVQDNTV
jgi:hypothetical protein